VLMYCYAGLLRHLAAAGCLLFVPFPVPLTLSYYSKTRAEFLSSLFVDPRRIMDHLQSRLVPSRIDSPLNSLLAQTLSCPVQYTSLMAPSSYPRT
jgi:hypothetical protein